MKSTVKWQRSLPLVFKDDKGDATMPGSARGFKVQQNLEALGSKRVTYSLDLQKGDEVTSTWISYAVNPKIAKKLELTDMSVAQAIKGSAVTLVID